MQVEAARLSHEDELARRSAKLEMLKVELSHVQSLEGLVCVRTRELVLVCAGGASWRGCGHVYAIKGWRDKVATR